MAPESYSVAEASQWLGVSIPTVKAMYRKGELDGFLTPGRHLRILAESLQSVRTSNGRTRTSSVSAPSTMLQMRRERIEFLNLEGEELRAQRELERVRRENAEEEEQRAAEKRAQDVEREARLEQARADQLRQERLQQEASAQQRRARLRQQVQVALSITAPANLSFEKHRALADALEVELQRANVEDPESALPIIKAVCERFTASVIAEEDDRRRRERIVDSARREIWGMWDATKVHEDEAVTAARRALSSIAPHAPEEELRCAAMAAIAPIRNTVEGQRRRKEIIELGVREVDTYLERLNRAGGIEFDFMFVSRLKNVIRARLETALTNQTPTELRLLVHEVIDDEIDQ